MTHQRQRFGALVGHDPDRGVALERVGQVHQLAVDDGRERGLRQPRRDPFRNVADRTAGWQTATRAIRKRDGDLTHWEGREVLSFQLSALRRSAHGREP
jgi:hypothetical protein